MEHQVGYVREVVLIKVKSDRMAYGVWLLPDSAGTTLLKLHAANYRTLGHAEAVCVNLRLENPSMTFTPTRIRQKTYS